MAYAKIVFENPKNMPPKNMSGIKKYLSGQHYTRKAPVGFSWTTLMFSWFVPLQRHNFKWLAIMFLCGFPVSIAISANITEFSTYPRYIAFFMIFFSVICRLVFPFIYNKIHIQELIKKGFRAKSLHISSALLSPKIDSLDSLSTKWNMTIPRLETENTGEEFPEKD